MVIVDASQAQKRPGRGWRPALFACCLLLTAITLSGTSHRRAPAEDIKQLKILAGHLKEGQFVTKIRKTFTKGEMEDDLVIVPAMLVAAMDKSEYEEVLPTSPP